MRQPRPNAPNAAQLRPAGGSPAQPSTAQRAHQHHVVGLHCEGARQLRHVQVGQQVEDVLRRGGVRVQLRCAGQAVVRGELRPERLKGAQPLAAANVCVPHACTHMRVHAGQRPSQRTCRLRMMSWFTGSLPASTCSQENRKGALRATRAAWHPLQSQQPRRATATIVIARQQLPPPPHRLQVLSDLQQAGAKATQPRHHVAHLWGGRLGGGAGIFIDIGHSQWPTCPLYRHCAPFSCAPHQPAPVAHGPSPGQGTRQSAAPLRPGWTPPRP